MIAVLGALPEEISRLAGALSHARVEPLASREVLLGEVAGRPVVVSLARVGKVAAATTAAAILGRYQPAALLFAGVAGAATPDLRPGDIVIGSRFFQHDLDASPLFPPLEVPLTGRQSFDADPGWAGRLERAARHALSHLDPTAAAHLASLGNPAPRVVRGDIATGDQFIRSAAQLAAVRSLVPTALCVEMEGAAVAQACHDFAVPFACMRVISDSADHQAAPDFARFVAAAESRVTCDALLHALTHP